MSLRREPRHGTSSGVCRSRALRLNHHTVMRGGLAGIRRRLGGVAGTYAREE